MYARRGLELFGRRGGFDASRLPFDVALGADDTEPFALEAAGKRRRSGEMSSRIRSGPWLGDGIRIQGRDSKKALSIQPALLCSTLQDIHL